MKLLIIFFLCFLSTALTYYFHAVLGIGTVFTHFFYVPIILSAIWWQRRGILVAVFFSLMLIGSHFVTELPFSSMDSPYNDYARVFMFLLISIVVVYLSEQIAESRKALKAHGDQLEELVRRRTSELATANETLKNNINILNQAEEAIRASETQLRRIIEEAPVGIRIVQNGKYVYVNPKLAKMFGYLNPDEIIGRPVESLFAPEHAELIRSRGRERLAGKKVPTTYELQGIKKSGEIFDVALWLTIFNYSGVPSILGFVVDISLEKKLRRQIFQSQKMESIGTLSGGIAHKFNNILSIISGNTGLAQMVCPRNLPIQTHLEAIMDSVGQMVNLNNMLLAFARKGGYRSQLIHLNLVIRETLSILQHEKDTSPRIEIDLDPNLPPIQADDTQIHMIVAAVVQNAIEAVGDDAKIMIKTYPEVISPKRAEQHQGMLPGKYVCIQIQDNGIGMGPEILERIFEPFFTTHFQGRGLGMAAVYGIVKNHKGWIGLESQPGVGTIVRIYLPIAI